MRPLAEFVVLSTLAGGVAMVFSTAIDMAGLRMPWTDSLKWVLPALAAPTSGYRS
ncbi:membrane protein, partial [Xanthomonas vesicatoria]